MKKSDSQQIILGVDIGTTSCKCTAFGDGLKVVAESSYEYDLIYGDKGCVEQDPEVWWTAAVNTIRQVISVPGKVKAIGISSQGISFVPVDSSGKALMNSFTWLDMRAGNECKKLEEEIGKTEIYNLTGKRINTAYSLPKMMWIKKHLPEVYEMTYKFLLTHDYIVHRLTGEYITEDTLAAGTMAYDINKKVWSRNILEKAGISINKLPEILQSGLVAGNLTEETAQLLGLDTGVIVLAGGQDQKCAAYGAGISPADITVSLGTSSAITAIYDRPVLNEDMSLGCFPFLDGKSWVLEGFCSTAGASVKWLRDNLSGGKNYSQIDSEIEADYTNDSCSDKVMFFPYLGGTASPEWYDANSGGFLGISLDTTFSQMSAAVLESIAFNIRTNIKVMESSEKTFKGITVFGGGAYSDIWLKIIADATNKPVKVPVTEQAACLGAVLKYAGALGMGTLLNSSYKKQIKPDKEKVEFYEKKYTRYKELEKKIYGR